MVTFLQIQRYFHLIPYKRYFHITELTEINLKLIEIPHYTLSNSSSSHNNPNWENVHTHVKS